MSMENKVINFAPGPAKIPEEAMQKAVKEFVNYNGLGISVMEMSHRSKDFSQIITETEMLVRELLEVPDNYKVLFMQGGGTGQFAAVAMNLIGLKENKTADYIITGSWSAKAAKEAEKYGKVNKVLPKTDKYTTIPDRSEWSLDPQASYVYYCANETVHGVEFKYIPETGDVPLVCDMSSNIMSRKFDVSKFGLIYAGAQKNIGTAGVTLVIVRDDLLGKAVTETPTVFDYKTMAVNGSLYNTPPTYSIYMMKLVFEWLKDLGGVGAMEARNERKARLIYDLVAQSNGFYYSPIDEHCQSYMNIPLRIRGPEGMEELEKKFVEEAQKVGMIQLKGHRSVGGLRVSLYNAVTPEETLRLEAFMKEFQQKYQ